MRITKDNYTKVNDLLDEYSSIGHIFGKNLSKFCKDGQIEVDFKDLNLDKHTWYGELYIYLTGITAFELINDIIGPSGADEIGMDNATTLRLWWD